MAGLNCKHAKTKHELEMTKKDNEDLKNNLA